MSSARDSIYERLLVVRCQAGDEHALVELVGRYQPRLAYFVAKMLGRRQGVDDLLQEIWLDVIRNLPKLKDPAALPAWLYRIARDRVYRDLRRAGKAAVPIDESQVPAPDTGDLEFDADDVALVHECLDQLTPEHREVLVLRFMQSLSYEDVAAVAGCEVGTVRSRLHYAKAALRRAMERKRSS